jgi:hypothetical protein
MVGMDEDSKDALEAVAKGATSEILDRLTVVLPWLWRPFRPRIPLHEAATKAYEAGLSRDSIYATAAEEMPNRRSPEATLDWIACFIAGKATIWGRRPPSRLLRPIKRMQAMYGKYSGGAKAFHLPGKPDAVFTDLQVSRADLRKVIAVFQEGVDLPRERPEAESEEEAARKGHRRFEELQTLMPDFFQAMVNALRGDTTGSIREFVLLSNPGISFNGSKLRFRFHETEHPNLRNHADLLCDAGYLEQVKVDPPIFRMQEHFVQLLKARA